MADLLGGELATGFIGFETVSRGIGGREGEQDGGTEEVSHGAGTEFQVVMKQLGKRDTTTKIKVKIVHMYLHVHVCKGGQLIVKYSRAHPKSKLGTISHYAFFQGCYMVHSILFLSSSSSSSSSFSSSSSLSLCSPPPPLPPLSAGSPGILFSV